ncbi:hypothetical protein BDD12DRAFT_844501 [Trichophaea hybrida]|nr:hypothetical protein BDD12DRAFT_844501 [Trichophaea hybrida]
MVDTKYQLPLYQRAFDNPVRCNTAATRSFLGATNSSQTEFLQRIENMAETFIKNRYLSQRKLANLLDELFPGQWSSQTSGDSTLIKAPRALTQDEIKSVQDLQD